MIEIVYAWENTKDAFDDETGDYVGQDTVERGISTKTVLTEEEMFKFIEEMSVSDGESEGHEHHRILAIFDRETGWYNRKIYEVT